MARLRRSLRLPQDEGWIKCGVRELPVAGCEAPRLQLTVLHMPLLKLIALDAHDVTILSAHLQDAVMRVSDIDFSARDRRLVVLVNRFHWPIEPVAGKRPPPERRRSALRVEGVKGAQSLGFAPSDRTHVLELLAVVYTPDADPGLAPAGAVTFFCAGGASLRLSVECVEMAVEDLGPSWQATRQPEHPEG